MHKKQRDVLFFSIEYLHRMFVFSLHLEMKAKISKIWELGKEKIENELALEKTVTVWEYTIKEEHYCVKVVSHMDITQI